MHTTEKKNQNSELGVPGDTSLFYSCLLRARKPAVTHPEKQEQPHTTEKQTHSDTNEISLRDNI